MFGLDDESQVEADESESDSGDEHFENLPRRILRHPLRRIALDIAASDLEGRDDDGDDPAGVEMLGHEVDAEGQDEHERGASDRVVDLLHHPPGGEGQDQADDDRHDGGDDEGHGQICVVHLGAGQHRGHRSLEDDQGSGIVEQALALQGRHDPARDRYGAGHGFDGDWIGRGEHGAERNGRGDRDSGDEEDRGTGDGGHGHPDQCHGHAEDRAPPDREQRPRCLLCRSEEQGRQEQREDELGVDGHLGEGGDERTGDADEDHERRPRKLELLPQSDHHRGGGSESDDHQQRGHASPSEPLPPGRMCPEAGGKYDADSAPGPVTFGRMRLCRNQLYSRSSTAESRP